MLADNCYRVFGIAVGGLTQFLVTTLITEQVFDVVVEECTIWFGLIFWKKRSMLFCAKKFLLLLSFIFNLYLIYFIFLYIFIFLFLFVSYLNFVYFTFLLF